MPDKSNRATLIGSMAIFPGDHNEEATPGPIPNPEVKLFSADDTALATEWESRSSPGFFFFPPHFQRSLKKSKNPFQSQ